jgi:hypothetical protein
VYISDRALFACSSEYCVYGVNKSNPEPVYKSRANRDIIIISKLTVFEFVLDTSETLLCSMSAVPSARCTLAADVVCGDVDVFGNKTVSLYHIL